MGVKRERARHPAGQGTPNDEVQRVELGQLVAGDRFTPR
ncbi:hypothetical protein ABIE58_003203 [Roseovarius sp. MBR-78]|jgi:hypothetical protein